VTFNFIKLSSISISRLMYEL